VFLISKLAAGGVVALGFAVYLQELVGGLPVRGAAVAAIAVLAMVNARGIKRSGQVNMLIVAITVGALAWFVAAGLPRVQPSNLAPFAPRGSGAVLPASALLFFAYTGYARLATLGEEVRTPERTLPRAIVLSLGLSAVLYFAVSLVAVGTLGAPAMAASPSPIVAAAGGLGVPGVAHAVAVGAVTAMLGVLLSQQLGISRMMLALARRGDLPGWLADVDAATGVPRRAIAVTAGILAAVALIGRLDLVVAGAAFNILLYYAITNLAALRLPRERRLVALWIPIAGLAACLVLAATLDRATILSGLALLGLGMAWRLARMFRRH
jgi:APA family basic amino acid/polyamine antiporter